MDSKVISLQQEKKKYILSRLMIVTLVEALAKQNQGIPFGPVDIKGGSFGSLIKRGLVVHKEVTVKNNIQSIWQVTPEAMEILKDMGVDIDDHKKI